MAFRTKLDYSDNRQLTQRERTSTILSGTTVFGVPFSALTTGPDLSYTAQTSQFFGVSSTYSGNSATTVFTWGIPNVSIIDPYISALTPSNSGVSQNIGAQFAPSSSTTIDGNLVNLTYSGVSAQNLYPITMVEVSPGNYSGSVSTDFFVFSAGTLDFTGRTIWIDNTEILRTKKLIVNDNPQIGYVLTCADVEGMVSWGPVSGATSGTTYWSASTGTNAIVTINAGNLASGNYALAEGFNTTASGDYSHAGGINTIASTNTSFIHSTNSRVTGARSAVLGGQNITGSTADTVYVPNLNINTAPANDDSLTQVLVRATDGAVKYRTIPMPTTYGLHAQTGDSVSVSATTVETTILNGGVGTLTVPANTLTPGDSFLASLGGIVSAKPNDDLTIRIKAGSVELTSSGPISMPNIVNRVWQMNITFTVRKIGVATVASIVSLGDFIYSDSSGVQNGFGFNTVNTTTFDTTISNTLNITAEWSSASSDNSIYSDVFVLTKTY